MQSCLLIALLLSPFTDEAPANPDPVRVDALDWPWWRGPTHNGIAPPSKGLVTNWSDTENILWQAPIPGRGHGSAIVIGGEAFIAAADHERGVQSVLCFDTANGQQKWEAIAHRGGLFQGGNKKASQASSTPACDGQRLFISFLNDGAIHTTAFTRQSDRIWQTKISDYVVHQGYGASPLLYEDLVIVAADNKGGGRLAALNRATGKMVWHRDRPTKPNYPSPVVYTIDGKDQLILTGCDFVTSLNPRTGEELWEIEGATTECVTTTVTDGTHVFTSGGYPKNHVSAVRADGSGKVVWEQNSRVYVPSMLVLEGHLYATLDAGIANCRRCDTGEEVWKHRLSGTFTSSPIVANGLIYATNEAGTTWVYRATPEGYRQIAKNSLNGQVFSTPTVSRDRLYLRVAKNEDGARREYLYCIGSK